MMNSGTEQPWKLIISVIGAKQPIKLSKNHLVNHTNIPPVLNNYVIHYIYYMDDQTTYYAAIIQHHAIQIPNEYIINNNTVNILDLFRGNTKPMDITIYTLQKSQHSISENAVPVNLSKTLASEVLKVLN